MSNEHFGIGIVEFMAAGAVPVAHRSGGPLLDIVSPAAVIFEDELVGEDAVGFLAATEAEYAEALHQIFRLPQAKLQAMQQRARDSSRRYSAEAYCTRFQEAMGPVCSVATDKKGQ